MTILDLLFAKFKCNVIKDGGGCPTTLQLVGQILSKISHPMQNNLLKSKKVTNQLSSV